MMAAGRALRTLLGVLAPAVVLCAASSALALGSAPRVGVVDERLVSQDYWIRPWAAEWKAETVAGLFRKSGCEAAVIGADVLKDQKRLHEYQAIMVPTDHCYPDAGGPPGKIAQRILDYVRSGGIYIMPMGAGHAHAKDVDTGAVSLDRGLGRDFLGLEWVLGADQNIPGPGLMVTDAGRKAELTLPAFDEPFSTYSRAISPVGEVYLLNGSDRPSLYMRPLGRGAVIHYAGGLPYSASVRDYIVSCYAGILKHSASPEHIADLAVSQYRATRAYSTIPVSIRDSRPSAYGQLTLDGSWELAEATSPIVDRADATDLDWTPVTMPNSIQNALFESGKIENPWYADNNRKLQWIAEKDWVLRTSFVVPDDWKGRRVRLRFDGLDYLGSVWLDDMFLGTHEGMLGGPTFDITDYAAPGSRHEVMVRIYAVKGRSDTLIKPDILSGLMTMWGNRYCSMGLWRPVRVVCTGTCYLEAPLVRTDAIRQGAADLWAQAMITNTGADYEGTVSATITGPDGRILWRKDFVQTVPNGGSYWEKAISLDEPQLWWPNGYGKQPLYRLQVLLKRGGEEMDCISTRFGIRTLEVRRNPYVPAAPRRVAPLTSTMDENQVLNWAWENADEGYRFLFVVNSMPVYIKGVSWLTSDDLLTLTPEREGWMVRAAKLAGVNMFRLNGGTCIFETEQFYNLCDENGILVWQELIFNWDGSHGSSIPIWRDQLTQSVLRIRQHPSLAMYCMGNEFGPYGVPLAPFLGVAREIFDSYDNRPVRMASPGAHGTTAPGGGTYHAYIIPEVWTGDPNWYPRKWDEGANFISEWSIYAFNNYSCLKRIIPPDELQNGPVGYDFDAFKASHPLIAVERYAEPGLAPFNFWKASWYGDLGSASVADLSEYSQMGHAQTVGYALEHWRSQFPYKGGETFWTYNVPQPVSSWNLIDWFGQPLMAYYAMKRANEPVHVVADTNWFSWGPGDTFRASVWALNDAPQPLRGARITARVLDRRFGEVLKRSWEVTLPAGGRRSRETQIAWPIPAQTPESYFFLEVTLTAPDGRQLSRQVYWMKVLKYLADPVARSKWQERPSTDPLTKTGPWLKPQVQSVPSSLKARVVGAKTYGSDAIVTLEISNPGSAPAFPVRIGVLPDAYSSLWSDNFFWLPPGESRTLTGVIRLDMHGLDPLTRPPVAALTDIRIDVSAWNVPALSLLPEGG